MGQPVRIVDLARRMIALMGLTVRDDANPDGDIEIQYTGLRPGEKLFEELIISSNVTRTKHPKIMRAIEHCMSWEKIRQILDELLVVLASFDCRRSITLLSEAVAEYPDITNIHDYVWVRKAPAAAEADRKVTELASKRRQPDGSNAASL